MIYGFEREEILTGKVYVEADSLDKAYEIAERYFDRYPLTYDDYADGNTCDFVEHDMSREEFEEAFPDEEVVGNEVWR